jgi:hypothetical protein
MMSCCCSGEVSYVLIVQQNDEKKVLPGQQTEVYEFQGEDSGNREVYSNFYSSFSRVADSMRIRIRIRIQLYLPQCGSGSGFGSKELNLCRSMRIFPF